VVETAELI
jgi:hypothetical protein